jgi:hypothetical protein
VREIDGATIDRASRIASRPADSSGTGLTFPSFIVFKFRFLEGVTIVVITDGHI